MTGTLEIKSLADLPPEIADQINAVADATVDRDQAAEAVDKADQVLSSTFEAAQVARSRFQDKDMLWPEPLGLVISAAGGILDDWVDRAERRHQGIEKIVVNSQPACLKAARANLVSMAEIDFDGHWPDYRRCLEDIADSDGRLKPARQAADKAGMARHLIHRAIADVRGQLDPDGQQTIELLRQAVDEAELAQTVAETDHRQALVRLEAADKALEQAGVELDRRVSSWLSLS